MEDINVLCTTWVAKCDTFVCLGDVGDPKYIHMIKAKRKILLLGNHDARGLYAEHDLLMDIRNGKYMTEDSMMSQDFWTILKEYEVKFEEAKINTKLPDEPDYEAIRAFRAMVNKGI
ncbi:MAG: hypothetical protein K6G24_03975, partial [Lachnospiraceae bacterium]|nr:hypothetical protein [Lachnospiraceae bacterium]